jgi:hypothetical protein
MSRSTKAVPPYTPRTAPLPLIGEHTLVRPTGSGFEPTDLVEERALTVWRLLHDLADKDVAPLTVLDIAALTGTSRGVSILVVAELLHRHQVRISRPHTAIGDPLAEIRDAMCASAYDSSLRSAKVVVLGDPDGARAFVGACSDTTPVHLPEIVLDEHKRRIPVLVSMGRVPLPSSLQLHLVALPDLRLFDVLWPTAVRDASGAVVVTYPHHLDQAAAALELLRDQHLTFQVVLAHLPGEVPDPLGTSAFLEVSPHRVTLCDLHSVSATRAALKDVLNQSPRKEARRV